MTIKEKLIAFDDEIYFFILKKVKNENDAKDILQNVNLKALEKFTQIKDPLKTKAWLYQIARNEINDSFKEKSKSSTVDPSATTIRDENLYDLATDEFCCFKTFINELPEGYKEVIQNIYCKGETQKATAAALKISLANVKIRVNRAKEMLKIKFKQCCQYEIDEKGKLIGEPNCQRCNTILS